MKPRTLGTLALTSLVSTAIGLIGAVHYSSKDDEFRKSVTPNSRTYRDKRDDIERLLEDNLITDEKIGESARRMVTELSAYYDKMSKETIMLERELKMRDGASQNAFPMAGSIFLMVAGAAGIFGSIVSLDSLNKNKEREREYQGYAGPGL